MTSAQRQRVRDLFDAALDRGTVASAELDAWLAGQASDDSIVREEVRSLVAHHFRAGEFLQTPVLDRIPNLILDDEPVPAGTVIGSYTIVRELGRGGMGRVYLATDSRLGRTVALKALAPDYVGDESHRERLRREARLAAGLAHPGVCTVYALEEIDGELYIASEFIDGRTLRHDIASGRRPTPTELLRVARELAAALAYAHARGVVHRDLKPENVMLTSESGGHVKILDFGLARSDGGQQRVASFVTQPGMLMGTPAYMAPEQMQGRAADARADVFAFGIIVHEYASGMHPFAAASPPNALDAAMTEIVSRCLRQNPAERFASAAELSAALDGLAAGRAPLGARAAWWRTHQSVIVVLYVIAAVLGWVIKEWDRAPTAAALFLALGSAATIGAVLRGHLLFTERVNRDGLSSERRRSGRATRLLDVLVGLMLFADGMLITERPLPSVLTISLALGILLAAIVVEPATTRAAFGDES